MTDQKFFITDARWHEQYPSAKAGVLVMRGVDCSAATERLNEAGNKAEKELRAKLSGFSRDDLNRLPVIDAYNRYYGSFGGKTYHVRSQVESIVNGKPISNVSPVVTAMFIAEAKNMLLTAGHDLDTLDLPVCVKIGTGNEAFVDIRGIEKKIEINDMIMTDGRGVISSIILGPDVRTKLTSRTENVMFTVYAPSAISAEDVRSHLKDIQFYVQLFSPSATTQFSEVFEAR